MEKYSTLFTLILLFLICSCNTNNKEKISTYPILTSDFENTLVIDGFAEPVRYTTIACPGNVDAIITFLIDDGTYVNEGDVMCILEDNNSKTSHDNLVIQLETAEAQLSKVKADLQMQYAMLEAQVKNNKADTEIAHLDSLQLRFSTPTQKRIKELELERAIIEKNKFEKKLEALEIINQSEVKKLELNIQQLTNRLTYAKTILDGLTIRAPHKGLAVISNSMMTGEKLKMGDNVWSNMPLITMPEVSEMKVKMMASEVDFRQINENDSVSFSFDAMPNNIAYGKITKKLPVGQPYKRDSKVKFFEVEASVDSALQLPETGFTANCRVFIKQVRDTIVVPQIAIYEEDSLKVVYVKSKKNRYEMRQIITGLSSSKDAIVSHGLKPGEVIALIKPPLSMVRGKTLLGDSTNMKRAVKPVTSR
ncbi:MULTISPECIES: efflux RND transporter periplasmic adaptor subunit [Proteiniphilum]|uniref:efflux RND transporter periplasmic adaptor subunit n=1 Tax=Proteiniphilum TaxID=294702 RepID=UPI001EEC54B8|nr:MULTISPECIES: hypothetical protein [Proteiniphilum]ULB33597.1 hypothetical protein KDN43_11315 [Proteiniphilum propionicum]